ncbi:MAG: hypothetical protein ACM3IJ_06040 [Candidatus Levyibacteriota bacterium]
MKLPFLSNKQPEKEYFLSLIFSSEKASSILFEKTGESLLIAGTHSAEFTQPLSELSSEKLIELSDVVISEVERKVPEGSKLEKTIFSVPHDWIEEGKITKEHLLKLKGVCEALSLTPIGFIVSIEAILAYLQKKEGAPVTAICVELSHKHLTLTLVKNGNIIMSDSGTIAQSPVLTTEELLAKQDELEVLPAKIILINYEHAKKSQQAFLSHHWSKKLPFLHIPQVEILDPEVEAQSVISGVAVEMGFSSLTTVKLPKEDVEKPIEVASEELEEEEKTEASEEENLPTEEEAEEPLKEDTESPEEQEVKEEVSLEDVRESKHSVSEVESKPVEFSGEEVGFFAGVDVLSRKPQFESVEDEKEEKMEEHVFTKAAAGKEEEIGEEKHHGHNLMAVGKLPKPHLSKPSFSTPSLPKLKIPKGKATFLYPAVAVVVLILASVLYYFFYEKVRVTLYLDKKAVSQDLAVTFSQDKNTSPSDKVVHISEVSVQEQGSEEASVTGKKVTGDTAKGEVTVYNKTEDPKTYNKGATIVGPNNLEFTLSGDVQVASTSSYATSFSSAKVKVEAGTFGKEYNLPSSTNFQFKGISAADVFAKNENPFSGGTKKEIQVVSADDLDGLTTKAVDDLSKKAISESQKAEDQQILPFPVDYSFDQKTFSKKEGDEASTVSLSAGITYKLGAYSNQELVDMAKELSKSEVPADYEYNAKSSKIIVKDIKKDKDGNITGTISFASVFVPKVSSDDVAKKISGKSSGNIEQLIKLKGVSDGLVNFTRSLPLFPKVLPFNIKNIQIEVTTQ